MGFGFRADNETVVDLILNVGLNAHKISGAKLDLTGKLGLNKYAQAHFSFDGPRTPTFNIDAKISGYTANVMANDVLYRMDYWSHKEEVYFSNMHWTNMDFNVGARNKFVKTTGWLSNNESAAPSSLLTPLGGDYVSAFATGRAYTYDNSYFPMRGVDFTVDYEWVFGKLGEATSGPVADAGDDIRVLKDLDDAIRVIVDGTDTSYVYSAEVNRNRARGGQDR